MTHTGSVKESRATQVGSDWVGDLLLEIVRDNAAFAANLRWAEALEQLPELWGQGARSGRQHDWTGG